MSISHQHQHHQHQRSNFWGNDIKFNLLDDDDDDGVCAEMGVVIEAEEMSLQMTLLIWTLVVFLIPIVLVGGMCVVTALIINVHWYTHPRGEGFRDNPAKYWRPAYLRVCNFGLTVARFWHGYEVHGLENIPAKGAALVVSYHGSFPLDMYYVNGAVYVKYKRFMSGVADYFCFKVPGFKRVIEAFDIFSGSADSCVQRLNEGKVVALAPGGIRESQFSDENYTIIWQKRVGFARVAMQAKVPIIPFFTENIRELFRSPYLFRVLFRWFYEWTRLPCVPVYGGFPVKLRTHIGKPIPYDSCETPEELALKVQTEMEALMEKHQTRPGSIMKALKMRFASSSAKCRSNSEYTNMNS